MSLAAAPDLIERVVGFRAWRVIDDPWAKARTHAHTHDPPLVAMV